MIGWILAIGAAALGVGLYEKKKADTVGMAAPPGATAPATPAKPVPAPSGSPAAAPPGSPPIPPGTPAIIPPSTGQAIDPRSPAANAIANQTQPPPTQANGQPAPQPPLPMVPPQSSLPIGMPAYVTTAGAAGSNDAALRVRGTPSTTGPVVAGGEPASGGGFDKGQTVRITGPLVAGFSPVTGTGRQGGTLTGYAWGGYLTGAAMGEVAAADAGNAPSVAGDMFGDDYDGSVVG